MIKLCPFRKETVYESGRNTGAGYPDMWIATEKFCKCLQEQCAQWETSPHYEEMTGDKGWCKLGV